MVFSFSVTRAALKPPQTRAHQENSTEDAMITLARAEGKGTEDKKASNRVVYVNLRNSAEDSGLRRHEKLVFHAHRQSPRQKDGLYDPVNAPW